MLENKHNNPEPIIFFQHFKHNNFVNSDFFLKFA